MSHIYWFRGDVGRWLVQVPNVRGGLSTCGVIIGPPRRQGRFAGPGNEVAPAVALTVVTLVASWLLNLRFPRYWHLPQSCGRVRQVYCRAEFCLLAVSSSHGWTLQTFRLPQT